ncbi:type I-B CRISPR-associated protein Cas7/Csh2 [Coprothermobacteraceae bacterium]|nr:type I-B CRISPR-associated protein Cas7/Csh2 [Coprothermobacteraceae bacterium]
MSAVGRREILFIYDVTFANPNGDPNDENKPRIDEETKINYVTDVRLKRTIRDYLKDYKGLDVFIYEAEVEEGRETKAKRLEKYGNDPRKALEQCIDLRLFGATFAIKGNKDIDDGSIAVTGPVQFKFGRSLHRVKLEFVKGITVMPSDEGKKAGTFTEKYVLPYSLIAFAGLVNGKVADVEGIDLSDGDLELMYEAMWEGTKALFTTSKAQTPRFLMEVAYSDDTFHIGDLEHGLKLVSDKRDEEIRGPRDYAIEVSGLVDLLELHKARVKWVRFKGSDMLKIQYNGRDVALDEVLREKGFEVRHFGF